jgi:2-polyprenyl-6-methoxyphenol hydroxylase-like FAD-dependent oxidoreductase
MNEQSELAGRRAVVIGASMAGLLTARVLADYYERVTLLERDVFPPVGESRKGVPQGRHVHALLARGLEIVEGYFPGLTDHLVGLGADYGDISQKAYWFFEGGQHRVGVSGVNAISVSRPLLEGSIRQRVLALPNVEAIEGCDALGLLATPDNGRVTGVRLIRRKAGSAEESLTADLVVDASGRGSRAPAWLEALGYERPSEETVKVSVAYTSCFYRRRPEHAPGYNALCVEASEENPYGGALLGAEGGRWIFSAAGYLGYQAAPDHASMLEYARRMATPAIYRVIKNAEPLTEPVVHKIPSSLRRRYERLKRFPQGYLVIGDALCSFNPVYGQGMSVAAQEAVALADCLRQGEAALASRFFKRAGKIIDVAWHMAVDSDLRFAEVNGPRNAATRFGNWYLCKLHRAAQADAALSVAFLKVVNFIEPPGSLMRPAVLWRILRGSWRARPERETASAQAASAQTAPAQTARLISRAPD